VLEKLAPASLSLSLLISHYIKICYYFSTTQIIDNKFIDRRRKICDLPSVMRDSGSLRKKSFRRLVTTFTSCHLSLSAHSVTGSCRHSALPPTSKQTANNISSHVLFCSLAVLNTRVGNTMDILSPFISVILTYSSMGSTVQNVSERKSCVIYLTKKILFPPQTVAAARIEPKICQSQPPTFSSHYSKFRPSRQCVVFLACMHLACFLALSLSPVNSFVSSRCDHSTLAALL